MPLMPGNNPQSISRNIKTESQSKPHRQAAAIALNTAQKNGLRPPPPPNSLNLSRKRTAMAPQMAPARPGMPLPMPGMAPISGAAESKSPFYTNRPRVQDGSTTMEYLERATKDHPTSENMEKSSFNAKVPGSKKGSPFTKGTRSQLDDKPPFMKED